MNAKKMPLFLENLIRAFAASPHGIPHGVYHGLWDTIHHFCGSKCANVLDSVTDANEDFVYVDGIELPDDPNPNDGNWNEYEYPQLPAINLLIERMNKEISSQEETGINNDHECDGN